MDVVILAGGRCKPDLAAATGVEFRADLPFGGKTMLETVLGAVSHLGEPIVVGGAPSPGVKHVAAGESFIASLGAGLAHVSSGVFLLVTVDLPCLTREAVDDLLERADTSVGLNYPIIRLEDCEREFPGMKRTTLRTSEGVFTGGNLAVMQTEMIRRALPVLEKGYAARKSPLKLAGIVGLGTVFYLLMGLVAPKLLTLSGLEKRIGRFLGVPVRAIETPYPEIGADIDDLSQYNSLITLRKPDK